VRAAASAAKRALGAMKRPASDFDASRYFRGDHRLGFYNVGTTQMRALARSIHAAHRERWSIDDAMALADVLIADRYLEVKSVGVEVLARYRRDFSPRLLARWKRWLASNHSANWATTDAICGELIGPLLTAYPHLAPGMREWAGHRNMWVRRASIVGLIALARRGNALDVLYDIARRLHADEEDLIQKAVGWALREAGKTDMTRLEAYLRQNGPMIPRTTLRYAIERFPEPARRALLAATRIPHSAFRPRIPHSAFRIGRPMGAETATTARFNEQTATGRARLEMDTLQFRGGDLRLSIPFRQMSKVTARGGILSVTFEDGTATFDLGDAATRWAEKILHPPSRLVKLGAKPDWRASAIAVEDERFLEELEGAVSFLSIGRVARGSDAIFFGVTKEAHLARLEKLKTALRPDGAIWVIRPKGRPEISERATMAAGKAAGLVDVKVVAFSSTHTAEKFVIPVRARPKR
jgi:3-methyladenine DNA glycosylase AlkD